MNKLLLRRIYRGPQYTIGHLYLNDEYLCDTLEDPDRDINRDGRLDYPEYKIYGETAIPNGTYPVEFRFSPSFSPKYGRRPMPYINNVLTHTGILIHWGNTASDTKGCILVGENKAKGMVINSKKTFDRIYKILYDHRKNLTIEVK